MAKQVECGEALVSVTAPSMVRVLRTCGPVSVSAQGLPREMREVKRRGRTGLLRDNTDSAAGNTGKASAAELWLSKNNPGASPKVIMCMEGSRLMGALCSSVKSSTGRGGHRGVTWKGELLLQLPPSPSFPAAWGEQLSSSWLFFPWVQPNIDRVRVTLSFFKHCALPR